MSAVKTSKRTITSVEYENRDNDQSRLTLKAKRVKKDILLNIQENMTHEEAVMENLLLLEPRDYTETQMTFDGLMGVMKDLWVRYQGNVTIATVVVNVLMRYLPLVTWLSHDHQTFVLSLINHQSNDIKRLVMKLWINLVEVFSNEQYITQCLQYTVEVIYSTDHALRVECLNLIGRFCHLSSGNNNTWLLLVTEFCHDPDPRVRKTAITSLLAMHEGGVTLDVSTYRKICGLLNDPDEYVRFGAIKLVHTIGTSLVDSTIGLSKDDSILMSLHDDAFSKLCGCVTDSSVRVRAYAARLLGEFLVVGERFLLQTLDKKLMSHLQVVKSDHQRRRELHHKGGGAKKWDTGKQWGGDIPHIDPLEVTLMSSGSCGAFVHCIEDEYMEVRGSAIRSIGNLSSLSTQFCLQSLDFLIDMINDEIQSVRLLAIITLRKVSSSINLREDQLESILGVLQESSLEIREALHSLLASSHVTSKTGLHSVVHSLLDNLSMYPSDRLSIWNCLKALGANHAHLVAMLSLELLSLHPYYMSKEPDINDNAYVSVLILIFNAASVIPTLTPLFPAHVFRHYHCTRDSLPHLIPPIKILAEHPELPRQPATPNSSANYLKQLLSRGLNLATSHSSVAMATLKQCCDDLNKLSTLEPSLNGCGLFSSQLLYCQVLMSKIEQVMSHSVMGTGEASEIAINIHELMLLSYRLQWGYINHTPSVISLLRSLRIFGHAILIQLVYQYQSDNIDSSMDEMDGLMLASLIDKIQSLERYCKDNGIACVSSLKHILNEDIISMDSDVVSSLLRNLTSSISISSSLQISDLMLISQTRCDIEEAENGGSKDNPLKFLSSLALSIPVTSSLVNVIDVKSLSLQIKFPDGRVLLFSPKEDEIRWTSLDKLNVSQKLIISHGNWTDSSVIQVTMLAQYSPDSVKDDTLMDVINRLIKRGGGEGHPHHSTSLCGRDGLGGVAISNTIKMNILPSDTISKGFNIFGLTTTN